MSLNSILVSFTNRPYSLAIKIRESFLIAGPFCWVLQVSDPANCEVRHVRANDGHNTSKPEDVGPVFAVLCPHYGLVGA